MPYLKDYGMNDIGKQQMLRPAFTSIQSHSLCHLFKYRNDPKFSDIQVWANSVDPDQTVPERAV